MPMMGTGVLKPSCDFDCIFGFSYVEPPMLPGVDTCLLSWKNLATFAIYESEFKLAIRLLAVTPLALSFYVYGAYRPSWLFCVLPPCNCDNPRVIGS